MFLTLNDVPELLRPFYHLVTREVPRLDDDGNPELVEEGYTYPDEHGEPVEATRWVPVFDKVETVEQLSRGQLKSEADVWNVVRIHAGSNDVLVQSFVGMMLNGIRWRFHDDYLSWLNQKPVEPVSSGNADDTETDLNEAWDGGYTPEMHADALTLWEASEPQSPHLPSWEEWRGANYRNLRKYAYPSAEAQDEMRYNDAQHGTSTRYDAIQAVKNQYPKPEAVALPA